MIRSGLAFVTATILLSGCVSTNSSLANFSQIQPGMSSQSVAQIMGAPQDRQFNGSQEAWQYCSTDLSGFQGDQYVLIWFQGQLVTGLQTYRNTLVGTCETYFRTVNWDEAPDVVLEIRQR